MAGSFPPFFFGTASDLGLTCEAQHHYDPTLQHVPAAWVRVTFRLSGHDPLEVQFCLPSASARPGEQTTNVRARERYDTAFHRLVCDPARPINAWPEIGPFCPPAPFEDALVRVAGRAALKRAGRAPDGDEVRRAVRVVVENELGGREVRPEEMTPLAEQLMPLVLAYLRAAQPHAALPARIVLDPARTRPDEIMTLLTLALAQRGWIALDPQSTPKAWAGIRRALRLPGSANADAEGTFALVWGELVRTAVLAEGRDVGQYVATAWRRVKSQRLGGGDSTDGADT